MAANGDSPKRRSLRLQRGGDKNVTPDSRSLQESSSGRRTSGPRTRLSAGKRDEVGSGGGSSDKRPQGRSRGQKAEDPGGNSRARGATAAGEGVTSGGTPAVLSTEDPAPLPPAEKQAPVPPTQEQAPVRPADHQGPVPRAEGLAPVPPTEDRTQSTPAPPEKSHIINGKTIETRRSRNAVQDNGSPSRLEPKKDEGSSPFMVNHGRNDVRRAASSQVSRGGEQEAVGKIKDVTHEGKESSSTRTTKGGEKAGPSIETTERTDVKEAGPSGVYKVGSGENAGPSRQSASGDRENANSSVQSPSKRPGRGTKSPIKNADQGTSDTASSSAPLRDSKVQCTSKPLLQEVLGMCAEFSKQILESQNYLNEEQRQLEHRNVIWNFETAFQDNVCINGQPWREAPDTVSEPDIKILEDQLDDAIVETAMKRKRHPRKILGHFVKMLKVEREILNHHKPVVEPKQLKLDSTSESRMTEQTATTASISQQIKETMKALPAQLEKAEGFSQVLSLQPVLQLSRIRQDIFSSKVVLQDMAKTVPKELETTPRENEPAAKMAPALNMRRRPSPSVQKSLYPLRSKRKISLEG
ncbi:kinetochore-associated protein NSL1 homolog isoform X1 [Bufo bufo]|uniref:kinetochore-associated protein NSL1 homolog isoform X1 n=2 Tax=Bufo bufo TaxID=8384 RepID=UPI001ABE6633|nr:kinetochore-associated protein NSL1 homolog isoform X1 [Bufo bufo]